MPKGISLHIGLNYVNPEHYNDWDGKLNAAEYDANDMQLIAQSRGFDTSKLLRSAATRENVIDAINSAASILNSGDMFLLTYSGHGGQIPDHNSDEDDALDETWCLYNGSLIDDELIQLWIKFKEDVRILVISDSCHSGTIIKRKNTSSIGDNYYSKSRYMPSEVAASTYLKNKEFYDNILMQVKDIKEENIKANVKLFSACQDNQESKEETYNGRYTMFLKTVWNGGKFSGNSLSFHKAILSKFQRYPDQSPSYFNIGKQNISFDNKTPFTI